MALICERRRESAEEWGLGGPPPPRCSGSRSRPSDFPVTLLCWVTWALELIPGAIQRPARRQAQETTWAAHGHYHFCFAGRGGRGAGLGVGGEPASSPQPS